MDVDEYKYEKIGAIIILNYIKYIKVCLRAVIFMCGKFNPVISQ